MFIFLDKIAALSYSDGFLGEDFSCDFSQFSCVSASWVYLSYNISLVQSYLITISVFWSLIFIKLIGFYLIFFKTV